MEVVQQRGEAGVVLQVSCSRSSTEILWKEEAWSPEGKWLYLVHEEKRK